jgi:hypothetical protein
MRRFTDFGRQFLTPSRAQRFPVTNAEREQMRDAVTSLTAASDWAAPKRGTTNAAAWLEFSTVVAHHVRRGAR